MSRGIKIFFFLEWMPSHDFLLVKMRIFQRFSFINYQKNIRSKCGLSLAFEISMLRIQDMLFHLPTAQPTNYKPTYLQQVMKEKGIWGK
jgi:hypothetical protein